MVSPAPLPALPAPRLPPEPLSGRLLTGVSTALDASMLRAMQMVVNRLLLPEPEDLTALRASAEEAYSPELQARPERFFDFTQSDESIGDFSRRFLRPLDGGGVWSYKLRTDYRPFGFDHEASPSGQPLRIERWLHDAPEARATVLTLHGFMMGNPRIDAFAMMARDWYREGLDVALMTLPYHSARAPEDATFSGDRFAVPHVTLLAEAVREAIYEIRLATRWLKHETGRPVGVLGLSLGGYLASLFAGLCDDADFVIPLVAPVCIGDLAWRFFTKTSHHKSGVLPAFDEQELRAAFRVHSPLAHSLKIDPERALIIGGRGDRIVPPEHPHALFEHWHRPAIHWFSGSHLAPFRRQRVVSVILRHLQRLEIL